MRPRRAEGIPISQPATFVSNPCLHCAHWRRLTGQRGECQRTYVNEPKRGGFLVTRFDDHCKNFERCEIATVNR